MQMRGVVNKQDHNDQARDAHRFTNNDRRLRVTHQRARVLSTISPSRPGQGTQASAFRVDSEVRIKAGSR